MRPSDARQAAPHARTDFGPRAPGQLGRGADEAPAAHATNDGGLNPERNGAAAPGVPAKDAARSSVRDLRRQLWLGAVCFALMLGSLLLALHAMRLDQRIEDRLAQALDAAARAMAWQQRLGALRAEAPAADRRAAQLQTLRAEAASVLAAAGGDAATDDAARRLFAALDALAPASAPAGPAADDPWRAAERALVDLVTARAQAMEAERARAAALGAFARQVLSGAAVLTLLLGLLFGVLAWRGVAAHRRLFGQLDQLAHTDGLTGALNRRGLDERLAVEVARADRLGYPFTLVMLDLDHFKRYNDRRGHAAGDALLRAAAHAWRRQLRPTDLLARYGGEEFTLVLPACDAEQAVQLVERLRPLMPDRQTFSAGIAQRLPAEDAADQLRRADAALLYAKRSGRNRSVVAGTEPQIALPLKTA